MELTLIPDGQLVPVPGDFGTVTSDLGLRIPPGLFALVMRVPRATATATRLCDLLDANPAHFIAGLPGRWKVEDLEAAKKRLFAQLAACGHLYVPPAIVDRPCGALPPPPDPPSR